MTLELAQSHAPGKAASASKAADSRFKSMHGKSQSDVANGFQSLLSAVADASSETVSSSPISPQSAHDLFSQNPQHGDEKNNLQLLVNENPAQTQNPKDPIADAVSLADSALSNIANVTPAPAPATEQFHALLAQSRYFSSNAANQPSTPLQPQALTLPSAPVQSFVKDLLQPQVPTNATPAIQPKETPSNVLPVAATVLTAPSSTPGSKVANVDVPLMAEFGLTQPLSFSKGAFEQNLPSVPSAQIAAPLVSTIPASPTPVNQISNPAPLPPQLSSQLAVPLAPLSAPSVQRNIPTATAPAAPAAAAAVSSASLNISMLPKDAIPALSVKTAIPINSLPVQPSGIQPVTIAVNQETKQEKKAIEEVKVASIQVSTSAPFARLAGLDTQERSGKAAGSNEFKPWMPTSFTSSNRMSDSSGSGAGKDTNSNSGSNPLQSVHLMQQPIPSEIKFNQWTAAEPATQVSTETIAAPTVITEREVLREEHAVFKSNQPEQATDLQAYAPTAADNSLTLPSADGAVPFETYVAEQVIYWINQDVHNAELKLEGIGIDPVQVNITMQGNEAFVTFTTDEQQARDALENARQQLEEMLQSQGVILSGLSVGSHGAGNSGAQERNPRQGQKQTVVAPAVTIQQENRPRAGQTSGSTLDLFV